MTTARAKLSEAQVKFEREARVNEQPSPERSLGAADSAKPAQMAKADYRLMLEGEGGGSWLVHMTVPPRMVEGDGESRCTIRMTTEDFVALYEGQVDSQQLFFNDRLQVEGDLSLAVKLGGLVEQLR
ncbi:SCP2 sterol-binding domain-containing protein [Myxococcota bacterium]